MASIINLPKDLQKQNFKEIIQAMERVPGWNILENHNLLALISPGSSNFVNFVWGRASLSNIDKIRSFYKKAPFTWITSNNNDIENLKRNGFSFDSISSEMVIDLEKYSDKPISSNIKVTIPKNDNELYVWIETAIKTFGRSHDEFKDFFYPLIESAGCIPLLAFYDNKPASTAMVYCGKNAGGIYTISTRKQYRRLGCATSLLNTCMKLAKENNLHYAVLYASKTGKILYESLGFKEVQVLQELIYTNSLI